MKIKKTIALFLVLAAALLVFTIPASAKSDDSGDAGIVPHYERCPDCGGTIRDMGTNWNNIWIVIKETKCIHYTYGSDLTWEDHGQHTWVCSTCGMGNSYQVTRTKIDCRGSDAKGVAEDLEEVKCTPYCYGVDLIAKDGTKDCCGFDPK